MINPGLFSSDTPEWATPQGIVDLFGPFDLDVCATPENAKAPQFFTRADDGLSQDWGEGLAWMNPPYGREIAKWVEKAARSKCRLVALIPVRTDTRWFQDFVMEYADIVFLVRGRIKFGGAGPAPFPSAIAVFDERRGNPEFRTLRQPS